MKNLIKTFILLCIVLVASAVSAAAAEMDIKVTFESETGLVKGNISISEPIENKIITVLVLDPQGNYNYIAQLYTDEAGAADFSYYNKGELGEYSVYAYADGLDISGSTVFRFAGNDALQGICDEVSAELAKAAPSGAALMEILDDNLEYFGLKNESYALISNKSDIYDKIAAEPENAGVNVTPENIGGIFTKGIVIALLNQNDSSEFVKNLWDSDEYSGMFEKESVFPKIDGKPSIDAMSASQQESYYELTAKKDYSSYSDYIEEARLQALIISVKNAWSWKDAQKALEAYETAKYISYDKTKYEKLSQPEKAVKELMNNELDSYTQIEELFNKAIQNQYDQENGKPSSSGSSGGGGGGGGGSSVSSNRVQITNPPPQQTAEPQQKEPEQADEDKQEEISFTDMDDAKWAIQAVNELVKRNIIDGYPDGKFRPNDNITRAEAAKLFSGFVDSAAASDKAFSDVEKDEWYAEYIAIVSGSGIMNGYDDGTFKPNDNITRAEAAVASQNLIKFMGADVPAGAYTEYDDEIPQWASESVLYLRSINVMVGRSDNMFAPSENLTRAEAARLIYNIITAAEL